MIEYVSDARGPIGYMTLEPDGTWTGYHYASGEDRSGIRDRGLVELWIRTLEVTGGEE